MKAKKEFRLALIGTETLRGKEIKNVLEQKKFAIKAMDFYDPGVKEEFSRLTEFRGEPKVIHAVKQESLDYLDLIFLAADKKTNREYGFLARDKRIRAIDLGETYSSDEDIPLIVAGINDGLLLSGDHYLVANPHPVTIILTYLFYPLLAQYGISKDIAFILEPASAFDESGIQELASQSAALLGGTALKKKVFKEQMAFNVLSHTQMPDKEGFSPSERRIVQEMKKILEKPDFPLSLSIVHAPLFHTYSIMCYLELEKEATIQDLENLFSESLCLQFHQSAWPARRKFLSARSRRKRLSRGASGSGRWPIT
jgi:aspartate-semialdehyde dehydrogenase